MKGKEDVLMVFMEMGVGGCSQRSRAMDLCEFEMEIENVKRCDAVMVLM